jgi:hypothetical protein
MLENLTQQMTEAVKQGIINALAEMWAGAKAFILLRGDQALLLAAMAGLIFYACGSRTAGRVIWWSIALFTLSKIMGIYAYGFFVALVLVKFLVGR